VHRAEQVGLDQPDVDLGRDLLERPPQAGPGVVDPDVDPAEPIDSSLRERLHLRGIGHVGGDGEHLRATGPAVLRRAVQPLLGAGGEDQGGPAVGERAGRGQADATRGTGDDDGAAVSSGTVVLLSIGPVTYPGRPASRPCRSTCRRVDLPGRVTISLAPRIRRLSAGRPRVPGRRLEDEGVHEWPRSCSSTTHRG
jgi:hypothetical protein